MTSQQPDATSAQTSTSTTTDAPSTDGAAPTIADVRAAAERLAGQAHRTPVFHARSFDERAGQEVWLKCEQFQRVGAFKFRGAYNKVATLTPEERAHGVIAFSSGNHAQAVALVAAIFGIPAVIVMPSDAPAVKLAATRGYGAEVVLYDRKTEDREAIAARIAAERGLTLVPPFNDSAIIAGAGTAALELLEEHPDLDVIATPVGGGGLLSGTALTAHAINPRITVIGVETEAANHAALSLHQGERVTIPQPTSLADGILTRALGTRTWPIVRAQVADVVLVSEEELKATMRFLVERLKLVVEPTGAVAVAAALHGKLRPFGARVGVIISGGNVAPDVLAAVLSEGADRP